MQEKAVLTAEETQAIVDAARAEAEKEHWAVAVAVVDDGGHLLRFVRLDGAAPISCDIAIAKARTSALGRRESRLYEEMINGGRSAFLSAPIVGALEGGVPIVVRNQVVGAVGVSGVKPEQDGQVAKAGARSVD